MRPPPARLSAGVPCSLFCIQLLLQPLQLQPQLHVAAAQLLLALPRSRCCACLAAEMHFQLTDALGLLPSFILRFD